MDEVTGALIAYKFTGYFGRADRIVWMDGRPHPSDYAEHTWDGFSTGTFHDGVLTVTTTHMKFGTLQRNGVPASPRATLTEYFMRHGDMLTLMSVLDDPAYLEEPMIRTSHWMLSSTLRPDERWTFEVVDEIANREAGVVPHHELGAKQDKFALSHNIPFEATQGGKETQYPEYAPRMKPSAPAAPAAEGRAR